MKETDVIAIRANVLESIGMKTNESNILSILAEGAPISSRELERMCDLRQPEVSIATKKLQSKGWVREGDKIRCEGKGRPEKTYELAYKWEEILKEIKNNVDKEYLAKKESVSILMKHKQTKKEKSKGTDEEHTIII